MNLLKNTIYNGWPPYRKQCPQELWEFWNFRFDLTLEDGLVLKGSRIAVPDSMRNRVLQAIQILSDQMPSTHELLFGRKPQTTLRSSRSALKSKHPNDDLHHETNQKRQERQAFYDRKAGSNKKALRTENQCSSRTL